MQCKDMLSRPIRVEVEPPATVENGYFKFTWSTCGLGLPPCDRPDCRSCHLLRNSHPAADTPTVVVREGGAP